jgi:hypothetical protein
MNIKALKGAGRRSEGYITTEFPDASLANRIVNPKRGSVISIPMAQWHQQIEVQDALFSRFKLDDLSGCTTAEMRSRPIPQVFRTEETATLTKLFENWAPMLYSRLIRELAAPIQVLNKTSRLGWPVFEMPRSKRAALQPFFDQLVHDGPGFMEDAFIIMNVRLQAESKEKKRDFLFVSDEGEVTSRAISGVERRVNTPVGLRIGSRTRLVFNLPVANLFTQILDTAMHNALLTYPAFHHDMYSGMGAGQLSGQPLFFDVKHFERHTSEIVRRRSRIIGGLYEEISRTFDSLPFLCPSSTWKTRWLLWPDRENGWSDQFASGYSPVAPVQKEIFWILYAAFATEHLGMEREAALTWVSQGGDHRLKIINYGDDNVVSGDPGLVREILPFFEQYLHVEEEVPPKFLGFLYTPDGWKLGVKSYLEKTYLNERRPGSNFRKYPCFGWVEKRKIYSKFGVSDLTTNVFPTEETFLNMVGLPWSSIVKQAGIEGIRARDMTGLLDPNWTLGKDWMMTPEEKLATGEFEGFMPSETSVYLKALLSKEWSSMLKW